jgi:hypothetical protein
VKYALLAILFLCLGYTLALFISPSDLSMPRLKDSATKLKNQLTGKKPTQPVEAETSVPNPTYPKRSYLTESDLLSIPNCVGEFSAAGGNKPHDQNQNQSVSLDLLSASV